MNFSLKLVLDDTARRARVTDPTWTTVQTLARDLHGVTLEDGSHSVSYVDSERERVTLSSTPELLEAVMDAQESGRKCLRLVLKSTAAKPESQSGEFHDVLRRFLSGSGDRELNVHLPAALLNEIGGGRRCRRRCTPSRSMAQMFSELTQRVPVCTRDSSDTPLEEALAASMAAAEAAAEAELQAALEASASESESESEPEVPEVPEEPVTESKDSDSDGDFCHVPATEEAPVTEFEIAHAVLRSMGFVDRAQNESVLKAHNGRVDSAVTALLAMR